MLLSWAYPGAWPSSPISVARNAVACTTDVSALPHALGLETPVLLPWTRDGGMALLVQMKQD